jgi:polar amino acid transport system permease protein
MMAARTLGMTRIQAIRHIILPQALRQAIPAWSNEAAIIVKDSSLVYVLVCRKFYGKRNIIVLAHTAFHRLHRGGRHLFFTYLPH